MDPTTLEPYLTVENTSTEGKIIENKNTEGEKIYILTVGGAFLILVAIFGIIGNLMTVVILAKPQMKSSMNYLLIGLTCSDTQTIFAIVGIYWIPSIQEHTGLWLDLAKHLQEQTPLGSAFRVQYHTSRTISIYLTLAITLERYVAVCHPLKARSMCTCRRALVVIMVVLIVAILSNLGFYFKETDSGFLKIGHNISFFFLYLSPAVALVWFNGCIYLQIRKSNKRRETLSSYQQKQITLAVMLLCIVIVFMFCNSLRIVWVFVKYLEPPKYKIFAATDRLGVTIYTSANFIIYSIFAEKFRIIFFKTFMPCCFKESSQSNSEGKSQSTESSNTRRSNQFSISLSSHDRESDTSSNGIPMKPSTDIVCLDPK